MNKKRDFIKEVLAGPKGLEKILSTLSPESLTSVHELLTWLVRSGSAWSDLKEWRADVRSEAFVLSDRSGEDFYET